MSADLSAEELSRALPGRPVRTYPALLSTEAAAMAWARESGPPGAVVVADYQASPRGRGGLPWTVRPGRGLGFSVLTRPALTPEREGWLYVVASCSVGETCEAPVGYEWPDTVTGPDGGVVARVGVHTELGADGVEWATITVLVETAAPPRGRLLGALVERLERRLAADPEEVLAAYRPACSTLSRSVRALLIPMGPGGAEVTGVATDVLADGALLIATTRGSRIAVRPQHLGLLEDPEPAAEPPGELLHRGGAARRRLQDAAARRGLRGDRP